MKKRISKNKKKNRILNKLGMTYVELLCALSLLSLIVVMFTPMLLSSYETLYKAGERTEEVYDSKEYLEQGLARRDSDLGISLNMNLKVSAEVLFENINVIGRKIVSTAQQSFETVFGQIRPSLKLISPAHVNDDSTSHEILIQTKGLEFNKIASGKFPYTIDSKTGKSALPAGTIHIEVVIPDKTKGGGGNNNSGNSGATYEDAVYSGTAGYCDVKIVDRDGNDFTPDQNGVIGFNNESDEGRIGMIISNDKLDFTYSPLKIQVYYVDTRGKTRTVCEYIYIDPATLMFAGETNEADYYTSAGVQEISEEKRDPSTGDIVKTSKYVLESMPRIMRTANSVYLTQNSGTEPSIKVGSPSKLGVEIKNIRWIANDETQGLNPYYVMTGTGGTIYRMYNYTSDSTSIYEYSTGHGYKDSSTAYYGGASHNYIDQIYDISTGHRIYPSLWSGDFSHVFEYTSAKQNVAYGPSVNNKDGDGTWLTSDGYKGLKGADKFNVFGLRAQYSYYYNGDSSGHDYNFKNTRPISYIITERGWPLRLFGVVGPLANLFSDPDQYTDFVAIWDTANYTENDGDDLKGAYENATQVHAFHYQASDDKDVQNDYTYSAIRIKSLASYDMTGLTSAQADYLGRGNDYDNPYSMVKINTVARGVEQGDGDRIGGQSTNITITDAIYIPSTSSTAGSTFYVGFTNAIANVLQNDKIDYSYGCKNNKENYIDDKTNRGRYYVNYHTKGVLGLFGANRNSYPKGSVTDYLIYGNIDGEGVYIGKHSETKANQRIDQDTMKGALSGMSTYINKWYENGIDQDFHNIVLDGSTLANRTSFFLPNHDGNWYYMFIPKTNFTMGYTSNRERVYANITYDGTTEFMRAAERLYWRSHYGQDAYGAGSQGAYYGDTLAVHQQTRAVHNSNGTFNANAAYLNSVENDYYNVWFPGEMYNLTNVASKDGVTVAVGYAVAGSAYQYAHGTSNSTDLTSTALGGIYNDGVLSAMVEGQDSAFVNLLYYKDNESFDSSSLWMEKDEKGNAVKKGYSQYSNYTSTNYGMHSRDSIQFTAVDIFVEERELSDTKNQLNYWAVYGDNKGRAYLSLVATGMATGSGTGDPDDENSDYHVDKDIQLVTYISDKVSTDGAMPIADETLVSNMIEIQAGDHTGMYTLDVAFSRIISIEAKDDLVIITGQKAPGMGEIIVVGECKDGVWSWKWVQNGNFTGEITDAVIANGYYYFVGYEGAGKSFLGAISLDRLKKIGNGLTLDTADNEGYSYDKNEVMWVYTSENAKMNTIAGRAN